MMLLAMLNRTFQCICRFISSSSQPFSCILFYVFDSVLRTRQKHTVLSWQSVHVRWLLIRESFKVVGMQVAGSSFFSFTNFAGCCCCFGLIVRAIINCQLLPSSSSCLAGTFAITRIASFGRLEHMRPSVLRFNCSLAPYCKKAPSAIFVFAADKRPRTRVFQEEYLPVSSSLSPVAQFPPSLFLWINSGAT